MESLRGIFPRSQPAPKRDFLRENVMRIKSMQNQRMRKSKDTTEYSNKFNNQYNPRKLSLNENTPTHRSTNSLQLCSSKAPINNMRRGMRSMSIQNFKEIGVQTVDPDSDQFFLKDSIIRYPSASTVRSLSASQQTLSTCSRGHFMEDNRPLKYKSTKDRRRDDSRDDHLEKHSTTLSDFYDKPLARKPPASILKSSSSMQKLNKDSFNESQQKVDRIKSGGTSRTRADEIYDDDNVNDTTLLIEKSSIAEEFEADKEQRRERKELKLQLEKADQKEEKRKQLLKEAANDPNCPDGHVPMDEDERLNSLKLAQKRARELIDELNRLPMTSETLRVRNRKIEIEKELKSLDSHIRVFSRNKVYVKLNGE